MQVRGGNNQVGNVVNNTTTRTFLNGQEVAHMSDDYNPMKDFTISPHERFQRMVTKIVNDVTTEENGRYANLGDPHNLGRFVDRLNRETGTYCVVQGNNNGMPVAPIMPLSSLEDYSYDMYIRNLLSECREEQRQRERERKEEEERSLRKLKAKNEYIDVERKKATDAKTLDEERDILCNLMYNLVCNQLSEFKIPSDSDMSSNERYKYLEKKVLYMKRKFFFVRNLQDVVNKIIYYELEYELKMLPVGTRIYDITMAKYKDLKNEFEHIMDNDEKLDKLLRDKIYNKLFTNVMKTLVDSVDDNSPDEHNNMLMMVGKLRNDMEFYIYDKRKRLDDILRMLMNYDDDMYKKIQNIFFSSLQLSEKTTIDILDHETKQHDKIEKQKKDIFYELPIIIDNTHTTHTTHTTSDTESDANSDANSDIQTDNCSESSN